MITEQEYLKAVAIVIEYHNQVNNFITPIAKIDLCDKYKYAKLVGIYDDHHDYSYLEIGKTYEVRKWYPETKYSGEYFSIFAGGKTRKYKVLSNMIGWEFLNAL